MYRHRVHDLYLLKWYLGVLWFSLLCPRGATRVQVISVLFSLALVFRETLERWLTHGLWFLVLLQSNPSSAWQLCLPVPIRGSLTSHQHTRLQGRESNHHHPLLFLWLCEITRTEPVYAKPGASEALKRQRMGAGEMDPWLRVFVDLTGNLGFIPCIHMAAHDHF